MADKASTATGVLKGSTANQVQGTAAIGVTIVPGDILYLTTDNTLGLADADVASPTNTVAGCAITGGGPGQPILYVTTDSALTTAFTLSQASGTALWLSSDTPGKMSNDWTEINSGSTVIFLGLMNTGGTTMNFSPVVGGVKA